MPCTVLHKIKRVDDRAGARVPIESERELQVFAFTRFPDANRCPSRSKPGRAFARKRIWLVKGNACAQQVRCARRLPKWHGNSGEVFANQAVTPSQEQAICCRAFFDSIGPKRRFDDA